MIISKTLPISQDLSLDFDDARQIGAALAQLYKNNKPYPHIVIDNFLPPELAKTFLASFPSNPLSGDKIYQQGYGGFRKRQVFPNDCSKQARDFFNFLNSAPILQFLEHMTGIEGLIADPYFEGGGFHEISAGGKLGIHADFRINEKLHLNRRLNLLLYLNEDWNEAFGGCLEIWDREMKAAQIKVLPIFNRCLIFNTDADSFHGHPDPLACPEHVSRKSAALYYYTASQNIYDEIPAHSTMYRARTTDSSKDRAQAYRARAMNYLRDWLPPVAFRFLKRKCPK